ncbi:PLP-dependent transferase [Weissella diestrammenae]|uniref:PLP-dependent transferase n=1 Tax=Weissella diestrammenae TaxID=1162633 RepID=A0A7G9T3K6_9LACO|nr:PLP-dependent aspartate aminotransferase family protein [Weissella diestrammenae]MCM0582654.1 PLP-dependent transferase [Weissella diestrammenae]QNN74681.1 PLP-dependent transferase [Weissella diestrammenae]
MDFETRVMHSGIQEDATTGAINVPIYQTSTYHQQTLGGDAQYEYTRGENPSRFAVESVIAALEQGQAGFAFSSGMAAIHATMGLLQSGDHIVMANDVYGGTFRLVEKILKPLGITATMVDMADINIVSQAIEPATKMLYLESPSNPLLHVFDIKALSQLAHQHQLMMVVDNTFASPYNQTPITIGADIVIHSGTKYLGGHGDLLAGFVVVNSQKLADRIKFIQMSTGAVLSPQDSYLMQRSIKTLAVRMAKHNQNALELVAYLEQEVKVGRIYFPGLIDTADYEIAKTQMHGFGGMISIELQSGLDTKRFVEQLKIFKLAESLGGVESLIEVPAVMTHASIPRAIRIENGITDELIRISVGIESSQDLIRDMQQAFAGI